MSTPDDQDLSHSLRCARNNIALQERIEIVQRELAESWERHRLAVQADQPTGASPVVQLKLEALAAIAVLSNFHCGVAHDLIDQGDHHAAHAWTLDEGTLNAAFDLVSSVDVSDC